MPAIDPWLFPVTAVLLAAVGAVLTAKGLFGRWFRVWGRSGRVRSCRRCRFDLSATEGHTCPECGHTARCEAEHYAGRFRWRVTGLGVVLLLAAVGVGMTPGVRRDGWLHLLPMGVQVRVFHLENNDGSLWCFMERLEGRDPPPIPAGSFQISFRNDQVEPHVHEWRSVAWATAVRVYSRGRPANERRTQVALRVFDRFVRQASDPSPIKRLVETRGLDDRRVKLALISSGLVPTPEVRGARRSLLAMPDDPMPVSDEDALSTIRVELARVIATADPDEADAHALANYLVGPPDEHGLAGGRQQLLADAPPRVLRAYAEQVSQGHIGSEATLLEGIHRSDAIASAAIRWMADQPPATRVKCLEALAQPRGYADEIFQPAFAVLRSKIDWGSIEQADLIAFVLDRDQGFGDWALGIIRDQPDHAERLDLIRHLGRSRFSRREVFRFATETLWFDASIPISVRLCPIRDLEGMPVDRNSQLADFTPYWDEVLGQVAMGDIQAFHALQAVVNEPVPPPPTLLIAIARRLVAAPGDPDPWLIEIACHIASNQGYPASLAGFSAMFDPSVHFGFLQVRVLRELLEESANLARTLADRWAEH